MCFSQGTTSVGTSCWLVPSRGRLDLNHLLSFLYHRKTWFRFLINYFVGWYCKIIARTCSSSNPFSSLTIGKQHLNILALLWLENTRANIDGNILPDLVSEISFKIASMSFGHVLIFFQYLLIQISKEPWFLQWRPAFQNKNLSACSACSLLLGHHCF